LAICSRLRASARHPLRKRVIVLLFAQSWFAGGRDRDLEMLVDGKWTAVNTVCSSGILCETPGWKIDRW
jgi:hypothetical protein